MLKIYQSQKDSTQKFNAIKRYLLKILGKNIRIEHVGSTAIPNIDGKGIIDILIGLKDEDEINLVEDKLVNAGYYSKQKGQVGRQYVFLASSDDETTIGDNHIHLTIIGTNKFNEFVILRNYLMDNPEVAKEYSDLKYKIAEGSGFERKKYKEEKSKYVNELIKEAKLQL